MTQAGDPDRARRLVRPAGLAVLLAGSVLASLGASGPMLFTVGGAALLLVLPLPHAVQAHRHAVAGRGLASIGASASALGLVTPALLALLIGNGSAVCTALVVVLLASSALVSAAVAQELGPPLR